MPIDILAGSSELREQIDGGVGAREIARSWEPSVGAFSKTRERYLDSIDNWHHEVTKITKIFGVPSCPSCLVINAAG